MKPLLLSAAALIAGTALAAAADLPNRVAVAPPVMVSPVFSWTGFYMGVHGAWIRDEGSAVRTGVLGVPASAVPDRASLRDSGFGGGGQIGYQMEFGSLVAGLEADLTATDVGRSRSGVGAVAPFSLQTDLSSEMSWLGSVRGRVGIALPGPGPFVEHSLVYVTGGLAYAKIEHRGQITVSPSGLGPEAASDSLKAGFVIGAGTEIALTSRLSIKTEMLYYNLEDETLVLQRAGDQASYRFANDGWTSRVGVNVRF